jgi:hypothetical protein
VVGAPSSTPEVLGSIPFGSEFCLWERILPLVKKIPLPLHMPKLKFKGLVQHSHGIVKGGREVLGFSQPA